MMKRFIGIIVLFLLLAGTAVSTNAAAQAPSVPDGVPDGLTATEWNNIQKQVMAKMSAGEQAILRASNAGAVDYFGISVAVSGDTVVVGAFREDGAVGGLTDSGAAYVFERNAGGTGNWGETAVLRASNAGAFDFFGRSVALSGDTAVVGANAEDGAGDGLGNSGAAYVFERNAGGTGNWGETAVLRASNAGVGDQFGVSVAVADDTAVVGAYVEDGAGDGVTDSGAAYLFGSCVRSAQSGNWHDNATWVGGVPPTSIDGACVLNGHTVTLAAPAAANTVLVEAGGVLDLATFGFTAENSVHNYGTMRQTQVVDGSGAVNFLQIRDSGNTADLYRGVDIATGVNLGSTVVEVMGNTAVCDNNIGGAYRNRCFMVNPTNAGTVNITLHSTAAEDDLTDDAFFQYDAGTTWTAGAACADGIGGGGVCTGSATFAGPAWFLIGSGGNVPTAVSGLHPTADSVAESSRLPLLLVVVMGLSTAVLVAARRRSL